MQLDYVLSTVDITCTNTEVHSIEYIIIYAFTDTESLVLIEALHC